MDSKVIGNAILKVRKERSLSQSDMANDLSVSRQAVSNWERGKTYPDVETLNKIAIMYHVSIDMLIDGRVHSFKSRERLASTINLILFLMNILLGVLLILYTEVSFVMIFVYLLCSVPMYLIFQYMLKTNSYSLMAGYNSNIEYNEEYLRKFFLELQLSILAITVLQLTTELVISLFGYRSNQIGGLLVITYIVAYTLVITVIIFRNKNKIKK